MNLTEATILALQGKLNLEESIDISIQDDSTMIDTDESTVIIQNKEELEDVEETECEDCEEPEVDEVPIQVVFSQKYAFSVEYYDNYNGLTSSKIDDPSISISEENTRRTS